MGYDSVRVRGRLGNLSGIISVRGDDRLHLDERLHDLRIRSLISVRMLWEQSERVRALGKRGSGRSGSARKKRRPQRSEEKSCPRSFPPTCGFSGQRSPR